MMFTLPISPVMADDAVHKYWLNGKELSGITGLISKHICPDKFKGIPVGRVAAAAERGQLIHKEIENYIMRGERGFTSEFGAFATWIPFTGADTVSEYLVSDNERYATKIDIVHDTGSGAELDDIKTTYELDIPFLEWQLGINAVLFEMQTQIPVVKTGAIWLRDDVLKYVEINRKTAADVAALFEAEANGTLLSGEQWKVVKTQSLTLAEHELSAVQALETFLIESKRRENEIRELIKNKMLEQGITKATVGNLTFTYSPATKRTSLDAKAFKADCPETYKKYERVSLVSDSIKVKVNNESGTDNSQDD